MFLLVIVVWEIKRFVIFVNLIFVGIWLFVENSIIFFIINFLLGIFINFLLCFIVMFLWIRWLSWVVVFFVCSFWIRWIMLLIMIMEKMIMVVVVFFVKLDVMKIFVIREIMFRIKRIIWNGLINVCFNCCIVVLFFCLLKLFVLYFFCIELICLMDKLFGDELMFW